MKFKKVPGDEWYMLKTLKVFFISSLVSIVLLPGTASACSCCADPGDWMQQTTGFEDWEVAELNKLNFSNRADLFRAMYSPDIKGIHTKLRDIYLFDLKMIRVKRNWALLLRTLTDGDAGVLRLQIPNKVERFRVDQKGRPYTKHFPTIELYKETRFAGKIIGEGIFKTKKDSDARYKLILQGKGNICDVNEDYRSWILIITGTDLVFTLHGEFEH